MKALRLQVATTPFERLVLDLSNPFARQRQLVTDLPQRQLRTEEAQDLAFPHTQHLRPCDGSRAAVHGFRFDLGDDCTEPRRKDTTVAEPVGATVIAWLWLGQGVDALVALGCLVVVSAVGLAVLRGAGAGDGRPAPDALSPDGPSESPP